MPETSTDAERLGAVGGVSPKDPYAYVAAFMDELVRAGVRRVVFCPGSRSTPLVLLAAGHPGVSLYRHHDERSAAFFALGMAKALQEPVALISTSGTGAANFHPAILEAYFGRTPLIALTADRPHEARDVGSPQTIDQIKLFGDHVKWFHEMAPPEASGELLAYARSAAARAAAYATETPAGPVHVNFPLREPLIPDLGAIDWEAGLLRPGSADWKGAKIRFVSGEIQPQHQGIFQAAETALGSKRGLIVCGPDESGEIGGACAEVASLLGWPILADPLSQLRSGSHDRSRVIDAYDTLLRDPAFVESNRPDFILRLGGTPASKPLNTFLKSCAAPQTVVNPAGWVDAPGSATEVIHASPGPFLRALAAAIKEGGPSAAEPAWLEGWIHANRLARAAIDEALRSSDSLFEGRIFTELAGLLPPGTILFAGNSMPVRDLDTFFPAIDKELRILANRGVNGIDGVVSTALGAALASGRPTVLVIGDLSFYHDLNGLLAGKLHPIRATIVLVDNDGGGIFSFLPQAGAVGPFEELFGTPHGLDFEAIVKGYGARWTQAPDWETFRKAVRRSLDRPAPEAGIDVIALSTDRSENAARHREIWDKAATAWRQAGDE